VTGTLPVTEEMPPVTSYPVATTVMVTGGSRRVTVESPFRKEA
jgi:hypothetical protein